MKKARPLAIVVIIILMLTSSFTGCVGNSTDSNEKQDNNIIETNPENDAKKTEVYGNESEDKIISSLIQELEKGNYEEKIETTDVLGEKGEDAATVLIQHLNEENTPSINNYAVLALIKTGDERVPEVLSNVFKNKTSRQDNSATDEKYINGEERTEEFVHAVDEKDAQLRAFIAEGLKEYDESPEAESLSKLLINNEKDPDRYAELALPETNVQELTYDEKVEMLIGALKSEKGYIRVSAIMALGEMKEKKAVDSLIWIVHVDNPAVRNGAAMALGNIGDKNAVEPLMLTRVESIVSGSVAMALGKLEDQNSFFVLEKTLRCTEGLTQSSAALALGYLRGENTADPLIAQLNKYQQNEKTIKRSSDVDKEVRKDIIIALAEIKDEKAVEKLIEILNEKKEDEEVRRVAAFALGEIGDTRATKPLFTVINDEAESETIRKEAIAAVGKISGSEITYSLISLLNDEKLGPAVEEALIRRGEASVEPLIENLNNQDEEFKTKVALLLIEIGDERAIEPLMLAFR